VLAFFTALNFLNYMDRYLLAALLPIVSVELGLNNHMSGMLVSAFVLGYVLCSPLFGYLGDRFSRPPLMALGVLLWSIATACSGLASGFAAMFAARVVVGIGEASFATLAPTYIRDQTLDPVKVNARLSIFFIAIPAGSALGYALAGVTSSVLSWHYAFFIGALPGILLAGFLLKFPDKRPQTAEPAIAILPAIKQVFNVSALRYAILGYIFQAFALNGIAAFITKLGVERGFKLETISTLFGAILVVTGIFGTYIGGKISSRWATESGEPISAFFRFLGLSSLAGVPLLFLTFYFQEPYLFLVFAALAELMIFAGTAPINSIIVLSAPKGLGGFTQGVTITSLNLFGALLGPVIIGKFADLTSLSIGLQLTTLGLMLAGFVWYAGNKFSQRHFNS